MACRLVGLWFALLPLTAASADQPAPVAPPPEDVVRWSIDATQRLSEIKERLSGASELEKLEKSLDGLEARFGSNLAEVANPNAARALTEAAIRDATSELDAMSAGTTRISEVLTQRSAGLEALSGEIGATIKRAEGLRNAHDTPLPEAIRSRLDSIVDDGRRLLIAAQRSLDRAAQLQNRILALDDRARAARADLALVGTERLRALIQVQQPPLWRLSFDEIAASSSGSTRVLGQALPRGLQFAADNVTRVILHVAIFVAGFALVRYLRRRFGSEPRDGRTSRAATRPISAAFLLALLVAPLLYPDAPSGVLQLFALLTVIPMLRILLLYLDPELRPALYALAGTFILERITTAFARDIVLQRLLLLLLSVVAIALFSWLRSLSLDTRLGLGRYLSPMTHRLIAAAIGVSALSLLFEVLGNVDLGLMLQTTIVRGAILAAAEYAAVLVLDEIAHLVVHSLKARGIRSVATYEFTIMSHARRLAVIGAVVLWFLYMLKSLRALAPLSDAIDTLLAAHWTIGQVTISLGRTLGFALSVWIAILASRLTQVLLRDDVLPRFALPRGVPNAISTVANYLMVLVGLLIGAGILGIELSNLTLIVSALGVGIGFGLQNVVNNLVSGFILIFERSIQIGDIIQLADLQGTVTQIGLRASRLRTFNGSEVVVPNGELISNRLINWTLSDRRRRLEATVGVAYGSDLDQVHAILHGVLEADTEVMSDPAPLVIFEAFGDSALNFRMLFWIQNLDIGLTTTDRINTAIAHALEAGGIEVPFPQRDVHIRTVSSEPQS